MFRTVLAASDRYGALAACATVDPPTSIAAPVQAQDSYYVLGPCRRRSARRRTRQPAREERHPLRRRRHGHRHHHRRAHLFRAGEGRRRRKLPARHGEAALLGLLQDLHARQPGRRLGADRCRHDHRRQILQRLDRRHAGEPTCVDCTSAASNGVTTLWEIAEDARPRHRRHLHRAHHPRNACRHLRQDQPSATGSPTATSVRRTGTPAAPTSPASSSPGTRAMATAWK